MKSNYIGLWLIITLSLALFLLVAFSDTDLKVRDWTVRKAPFADALLAMPAGEVMLDSIPGEFGLTADTVPEVQTTDSVPKSILLIGDSMTFNLALRLAAYAAANGHTLHAVNWDSSNTKIWAESDTLRHFMRLYNVDYVFVSLGSNELYFKKPEARLPYVKRILAMIDTVPYVWIGPPNWQEDSGINDMLQRTCRPGTFFRSAGMEFERKKDKVHPTRRASALWIDSIMRWLPQSSHPILNELPSDTMPKPKVNVVFLKALNK